MQNVQKGKLMEQVVHSFKHFVSATELKAFLKSSLMSTLLKSRLVFSNSKSTQTEENIPTPAQ